MNMRQITKKEALQIAESNLYSDWSFQQKASFQLRQDRLCMPFSVFHEAVEKTLNRPVYTHELALNRQGIIDEVDGIVGAPSIDEIIALAPEDKVLIVR